MKDNDRLENLVQQLYKSEKLPRSLFNRFEKLFPEIEDEFRKGFSHLEIFTALVSAGMDISWNTYRVYLKRSRKGGNSDKHPAVTRPEERVVKNASQVDRVNTKPTEPIRNSKAPTKPPEFQWQVGEKVDDHW